MLNIVLGGEVEKDGDGDGDGDGGLEVIMRIELSDEIVDELGGVIGVAAAIHSGLSMGAHRMGRDLRITNVAKPEDPPPGLSQEDLAEILAKAGESATEGG